MVEGNTKGCHRGLLTDKMMLQLLPPVLSTWNVPPQHAEATDCPQSNGTSELLPCLAEQL